MKVMIAIVVCSVFAASTAEASPAILVPIGLARYLPLGTHVKVLGSATSKSGNFASSFFDNGFGLQDIFAGIYIAQQTDAHVAIRQRVEVTGVLADQFGLRVIIPDSDASVHKLGTTLLAVHPREVDTGDVNEHTEGALVEVDATITDGPTSDAPYGFKFTVDDGSGPLTIFINDQTGIAIGSLHTGDDVSVTGFSSQFDTHYEIDPRTPADIVVSP